MRWPGPRRGWIPAAAATLAALTFASASALAQGWPSPEPPAPERHVIVGMGENTELAFADPRFTRTGIRHVRLIVPYDVVRAGGWWLDHADVWLDAARLNGQEPLVSFGFSQRRGRRWRMPSAREYGARVREFRRRYPWVSEYTTWNEANHKRVQPTGKHPVRTAALYRELRRQCRAAGCTAVAVDLLVTGSRRTWRWIRSFRRRAGPAPHIWGVHNYPDANRRSSALTRRFLRRVRGEVWFTETGGIVRFGHRWRRSERRAALALRHVFRLASISPRVKRVYVYNWRATRRNRRWDSGLISAAGRARGGYYELLDALDDERFRPRPPEPAQLPPLTPPLEPPAPNAG